jgi:hypothetical protein
MATGGFTSVRQGVHEMDCGGRGAGLDVVDAPSGEEWVFDARE